MKNYLLDLLKHERSSINSQEVLLDKALQESANKLNKDWTDFNNFVEREKRVQKANEQRMFDYISENKKLADRKKSLFQESKQTEDELDRHVKMILNLKGNAIFVYKVLGGITIHIYVL
jgi:hypothetical protein